MGTDAQPSARLIRLRRPPVLRLVDEPFVPSGMTPAEIEERWQDACARNARLHDGRLLHVVGVHRNGHGGATLHVVECAYRYFAVHAADARGAPEARRPDSGIRPLGVKGIVQCGSRVLVGRRAAWVAAEAGRWELAPGGGVEPARDPQDVIVEELRDETGLRVPRAGATPIAIAFDPSARSWEIVYRIELELTGDGPAPALAPSDEYDRVDWHEASQPPPQPLSPIAAQLWPIVVERHALRGVRRSASADA